MEQHPDRRYLANLRILSRFVYNGSFGYRESKDAVFHRLKTRYPEAYSTFGEERQREVLERYERSLYIELQRITYPANPDKDDYLVSSATSS